MTAGRPKDPRGRPFKVFTAIVEQFGKLTLHTVRAHDGEHASELAGKQAARSARLASSEGFEPHYRVRGVLVGTARMVPA